MKSLGKRASGTAGESVPALVPTFGVYRLLAEEPVTA
jgi:hypothetical protein